ncbi:MAG: P-loop NTPase [Kofleriaceae bacterium]|nr:P-loop NTPase [Kofleriaceae bacterium]
MTAPALIDRRLLLVSGKGGVGKSTVAAALATAAVRRGRKVRLDEVGHVAPAPLPGVAVAAIDGDAALDEYLGRIIPRVFHHFLVRNPLYRRFAAGAPGLADLMVLGKLADDARVGGWDLVIADVGATGHALQLLGMAAAADAAFGAGLVRKEVDRIRRELADPAYAAVVPVTTPEQLAIDEALELDRGARALGLAVGPVIVNRVHDAPCEPDDVPAPAPGAAPLVVEALRRGRSHAVRAALDRVEIARLEAVTDDAVRLPALMVETFGAAALGALADLLEVA